jgi:uncharacterized protein YbbC (DUF1343 family)/CubicO group peptidase (beta-lactamase class C family)
MRTSRSLSCLAVAVAIFAGLTSVPAARAADQAAAPSFAAVDQIVNDAVASGAIPGGVLLVGQGDAVLYRKAYGSRAVEPAKVAMTEDTIFDMASCSKVIGTATSVMILVDRGKINVTDPVAKYLPAFAANGKAEITVEQLLLHRSGLTPDNSLKDYADGPAKAMERVYALPTVYPPGSKISYSDVNYIVLGEIVRTVSGKPLSEFARDEIFRPLGLKDTCYLPAAGLKPRIAPTEQRENRWMIGEVHDPRAYLLGGFAGHAGVFSTVDDVGRYCRMILAGGTLDGKRILSEAAVREMLKPRCLEAGGGCRGYGWDILTPYSSPRGRYFTKGVSFGHTGYTGTAMWLDPVHNCYVIFLTNHVHPKDTGSDTIVALRRKISTAVGAAILPAAEIAKIDEEMKTAASPPEGPTGAPAKVLCGIDVLKRDGYKPLVGRKIALITNHTGRDQDGNRNVDLLRKAPGLNVVKIFSPEHGLYGAVDEKVGNTIDKETGLQVYSLYGETRRPNDKMLEGIDTLVFDIQDIGARFYTYPATMGWCMEEAAKRNIKFFVLDRPNPITGLLVAGPLADKEKLGFTALMQEPIAHGLTLGELATMFNAENKVGCDLTVIKVEGWKRSMWYDETGLMWVNPSPNMRNLTQGLLYLDVCLLEATNVSVGRGTDQPFEMFGAPWIDSRKLSAALNGAKMPGLRFLPIEFTPAKGSKLGGQKCGGVYVMVTDRLAVESVTSGLKMAWYLKELFGDKFEIKGVNNLLVNTKVMDALKTTKDPSTLPALWADDLAKWKAVREKYLMYK